MPRFVDYGELALEWPGGRAAGLPGDDGLFEGEAILEVTSQIDAEVHAAPPLPVSLDVRDELVTLVPEFVAGSLVRYVLSEEDDLGRQVNLRRLRYLRAILPSPSPSDEKPRASARPTCN